MNIPFDGFTNFQDTLNTEIQERNIKEEEQKYRSA